MEYIEKNPDSWQESENNGLRLLWITPLRALSKEIQIALQQVCDELSIPWQVQIRTGDTDQKTRAAQKKRMPEVLITTPESLMLLFAQKNNTQLFKNLQSVVVDEWHELIGSKRGVQTELGLSRLRYLVPSLKIWAVSATIGNLTEARDVLLGMEIKIDQVATVIAKVEKRLQIETILPDDIREMPWAGRLGVRLLDKVIPIIQESKTTLIFTNTRAQCEIWYQFLLSHSPDLAGLMAMHHGSIERELRDWVEEALNEGTLKAVVCTSSLDLGVDFKPVDTVIQIGSPKGIARFSQRAGRSGHSPGALSKIYFLPTHALELLEGAALKEAVNLKFFENREPIRNPLDVLIQYLVTLAVGEGMNAELTFEQVRSTFSFSDLSSEEWQQILHFISTGGPSLNQYDEFKRWEKIDDLFKVTERRKAMRHRLQIGTIVGSSSVRVKIKNGPTLGTVEEYAIARMNKGDTFWFAGRMLEFLNFQNMTAIVRAAKGKKAKVLAYQGGRLPLSSKLSEMIRKKLTAAMNDTSEDPEVECIRPLLDVQQEISTIPREDELLIEYFESKDGYHLLVYPFEGRFVHEGIGALVAYRLAQIEPMSFSMAMNDYGFELLTDKEIPIEQALKDNLFSDDDLTAEIQRSVNMAELARRKFREVSVIAGLVFQGYPGRFKRDKHLQSSSQLLFDVFRDYESEHLLLKQAYKEVLDDQLEEVRLRLALKRIQEQKIVLKKPPSFSPFSLPIIVDGIREKMSNESLADRISKMELALK